VAVAPVIIPTDRDEDGDILPPTNSEVTSQTKHAALHDNTPAFLTRAQKAAFFATLPTAIQLQLEQPFGKDNLNQCYYLQKTGKQALFLLFRSGYMTCRIRNKLERAFPPARHLSQLLKRYQNVDFRTMQGFQMDWQQQTELSGAHRDMTTACLIYFKMSLPAMVRWIGGPHVAAHRDNAAIFGRLKTTCKPNDYDQLVRVFTKGSPTFVNAYNTQANYHAYRDYGNHTSIEDNKAMVDKTLLKEVA
jgi:hypothetical protein